MDSCSKDTLLAIEQNSNRVISLETGAHHNLSSNKGEFNFNSKDSDDYDRLGTAIGNHTHLKRLDVSNLYNNVTLNTTNKRFYDGIRHNSSITELMFTSIKSERIRYNCVHDIDSICIDVAFEVLRACKEKNILTQLHINTMPLVNSGERLMAESLRGFTNLRKLAYLHSNITDDQLLPMVEAITGYPLIEELDLSYNRIGNAGCEALATLRNVTYLRLMGNNNSNQFDRQSVNDSFCASLCNTSSINDIYLSNHKLEKLHTWRDIGAKLDSLLALNKSTKNKRHVAIKKILLYYPHNIDMKPLFDLSVEEDDSERDLKALPYAVSWFETATEAIIGDERPYPRDEKLSANDLECKKISAIYQFVTAMPMLFVSDTHTKELTKSERVVLTS